MVINGSRLLFANPIQDMDREKRYGNGVSHGLGEAGYDIRIKQDVTFTRDLFGRALTIAREFFEFTPGDDNLMGEKRERGRFCLASAVEKFDMPDDLVGIVHDKSTWAGRGLSVFNTVIEPGWKGFLTLELVYHGWRELHIPAGSGIAQVIFHHTAVPSRYSGRYQHQANEPVEAIEAR